jgi:hypothetical protein
MTSKEFYNIMISKMHVKPASETTLQNRLGTENLDWPRIYLLSGEITIDTYSRMFNFKLNHNILYLNKLLTKIGLLDDKRCSLCYRQDETPIHLFSECYISVRIWKELQRYFNKSLEIPDLTPQSAFLGFFNLTKDRIIINHLLLIFKITLYQGRSSCKCSFQNVMANILRIKKVESHLIFSSEKQKIIHRQKWSILE